MTRANRRNKAYTSSVPLRTFIGREREIADVSRLISSHRLVTLTGAGGSGKTRLSIQVADEVAGEFEDGVWFIGLDSIFDPDVIPQTLHLCSTYGRHLADRSSRF